MPAERTAGNETSLIRWLTFFLRLVGLALAHRICLGTTTLARAGLATGFCLLPGFGRGLALLALGFTFSRRRSAGTCVFGTRVVRRCRCRSGVISRLDVGSVDLRFYCGPGVRRYIARASGSSAAHRPFATIGAGLHGSSLRFHLCTGRWRARRGWHNHRNRPFAAIGAGLHRSGFGFHFRTGRWCAGLSGSKTGGDQQADQNC